MCSYLISLPQEKEEFVSHMMAGVELMVKPVEEAVLAKSQEILNSQVKVP